MENISKINKYQRKEIEKELRGSYNEALENNEFIKLVNKLKLSEEQIIKNTTKLERTVEELANCKNCKGLGVCKNNFVGCVCFPTVNEGNIDFSYIPCKYKKEEKKLTKTAFYETPLFLRNARMSEIYTDDKARIKIIKYLKEFINFYDTKKIKGLYLHGSFGSGKSYMLSALLNEMSNKGKKCVNVYFPSLLRILKEGFNDNSYDSRLNEIMKCDILLIDDIGAETNTTFSRDEILGTVLQYRMDNALSTFFTSNFSIEEIEMHLKTTSSSTDAVKSKRIVERIKQLTCEEELVGENRRK